MSVTINESCVTDGGSKSTKPNHGNEADHKMEVIESNLRKLREFEKANYILLEKRKVLAPKNVEEIQRVRETIARTQRAIKHFEEMSKTQR